MRAPCAMLINGRARMACSALIDNLEQPVTLEPFSKFPVIRDLAVDRSVLFENLKIVKAWVPVDGTYDLGAGPKQSAAAQEEAYPLSRCIPCCCCMEACPQFNDKTGFVGAATISQVRLFNTHPTGQALKFDRLKALMGDGGIQECGFAQNCVEVCLRHPAHQVHRRCRRPGDVAGGERLLPDVNKRPSTRSMRRVGWAMSTSLLGNLPNYSALVRIHRVAIWSGLATKRGGSIQVAVCIDEDTRVRTSPIISAREIVQ